MISALSTHYPVNLEEFGNMCQATKAIYMEHYSNIPMNVSLHKLLDHGVEIIMNSILPPSYFCEEAAEAKNKLYRNDRENHARKTSRIHNLNDVFKRANLTSDPKISSISLDKSIKKKKKFAPMSLELQNLLITDTQENGQDDSGNCSQLEEEEEEADETGDALEEEGSDDLVDDFDYDFDEDNVA